MTTPPATTPPTATALDLGVTRSGVTQLRRSWVPDHPWAALVIVHGIGEHSGRYEAVGHQLAEAGIATIAYDQRGFGQSGGRRAHIDRWSDYLDDVEDHLREVSRLGLPTVLLGHSMGGLMSLDYALDERPPPDRLVLSAPAVDADTPSWMRGVAGRLATVAPHVRLRTAIDPTTLSRDPEVQEAYASDPLVEPGGTTRLGAELFGAMDRVGARLSQLDIPTYLLHGDEDELVPTASSEALGQVVGVERVVYPGLRHECFNEPEGPQVVADLVQWLHGTLPTGTPVRR